MDTRRQLPIEDYAPIGDGRTVALVGSGGQIDWLPLPDLTSTPLFARLVDIKDGGFIELAPTDPDATATRRYASGTNVLRTTWHTRTGRVRVTDAMVTGSAGRLPWAHLVRLVEGLDGEVEMRWRVQPGSQLGSRSPWIERHRVGDSTRAVIRSGSTTVGVTPTDAGTLRVRQRDAAHGVVGATFSTAAGSSHSIEISATHDEPLHLSDLDDPRTMIDQTVNGWRTWTRQLRRLDSPWDAEVERSALILKQLVHAPSGAIAAAATTSLPESAAGGKNWDYRFAWIRDLAYTVDALYRLGCTEETHAALSWILRTIKNNGPRMHVFYALDGTFPTDGVTEHPVGGWRDNQPVVSGNRAADQLQLGVYGDLFQIVVVNTRAGNVLDRTTGELLRRLADEVCDSWQLRDAGMWELLDEEHWTASKMGCWQALTAAVELAEGGHIPGDCERWRVERDRIHAWVVERCYDEELGAYTAHPHTRELDTAVLLHALSGFDTGPRMRSTIDAITAQLGSGPLLHRYTPLAAEEHAFVACSFWLAAAEATVGRLDRAIEQMEATLALANDVGIFSEMIDPATGAFWGNTPQGLSHLALIQAATTVVDCRDG